MFPTTTKNKILIISALLVLTGFSAIVASMIYASYSHAREAVLSNARLLAERESGKVSRQIEQAYLSARSLGDAAIAVKNHQPGGARELLSAMTRAELDSNPDAIGYWLDWEPNALDNRDSEFAGKEHNDETGRSGVYWLRKNGKIDVVWGGSGVDQVAYYTQPLKTARPFMTEPYIDEDVKILMGTVSVPLLSNGKVLGVAGCDMGLAQLTEVAARVKPFDSGFMTLYSSGGLVLAGPAGTTPGKADEALPSDARQAIKAGDEYSYASSDGFQHFLVPVKVQGIANSWSVRISIPLDVALAPVKAAAWQSIGSSVLILLVILVVLGMVVQRLLAPLDTLQRAMSDLSNGSGDLTRQLPANTQDEIGKAASAFNHFTDSLRHMLLEVRTTADTVRHAVHDLSEEIGHISAGSSQQAMAANATAASIEQLSVSISHIADSVRSAENEARNTGEVSESASQTVAEAVAEINRISATIKELAQVLGSLEGRSNEISSIIGVISDIADQTNLLALNATIEAARAGEQGRGFAVVADEVRKLAERTSVATREIGAMITAIQSESRSAVSSMATAMTQVEHGVGLADNAAVAIRQIHDHTRSMANTMGDIAVATGEQSTASQQIALHIEQIHSMVHQNDESVKKTEENTRELADTGSSLSAMMARFTL